MSCNFHFQMQMKSGKCDSPAAIPAGFGAFVGAQLCPAAGLESGNQEICTVSRYKYRISNYERCLTLQ